MFIRKEEEAKREEKKESIYEAVSQEFSAEKTLAEIKPKKEGEKAVAVKTFREAVEAVAKLSSQLAEEKEVANTKQVYSNLLASIESLVPKKLE